MRKETQRAYTRFSPQVINKNKVKRGKSYIRHNKQVPFLNWKDFKKPFGYMTQMSTRYPPFPSPVNWAEEGADSKRWTSGKRNNTYLKLQKVHVNNIRMTETGPMALAQCDISCSL